MATAGFVVEEFTSASDFLNALSPWNARWNEPGAEWIFRGHANSTWQLVPHAFRPTLKFHYGPDSCFVPATNTHEQLLREADVVRQFVLSSNKQGLPLPVEASFRWVEVLRMFDDVGWGHPGAWPPSELLPTFALAQHYGVPTRLLDWTERPFVSAYFAALGAAEMLEQGSVHGKLAVWAMDRGSLVVWLQLAPPPFLKFIQAPRFSNPNLHAQEGVFSLLLDPQVTHDSPVEFPDLETFLVRRFRESEEAGSPPPQTFLRRLEIPVVEAGYVLRMLAQDRISGTYMYPGYDGVVRGLKERRLWKEE